MAAFRFASPERRWRAGFLLLLGAWFGWRGLSYGGPDHSLGLAVGCLLALAVAACAIPVGRTCLIVTADFVTDRRAVRTIQVPWPQIADVRVDRPSGPWGGFCLVAECRDGTSIDLLSTRVYSRAPSSRHLDEIQRLCWTLQERLAAPGDDPVADL